MTRYYKRDYDDSFYFFDSKVITEEEFDEKLEYDSYSVFSDALTGDEILNLINENDQLKINIDDLQDEINYLEDRIEDYDNILNDDGDDVE